MPDKLEEDHRCLHFLAGVHSHWLCVVLLESFIFSHNIKIIITGAASQSICSQELVGATGGMSYVDEEDCPSLNLSRLSIANEDDEDEVKY